jgi:hypothetical protein
MPPNSLMPVNKAPSFDDPAKLQITEKSNPKKTRHMQRPSKIHIKKSAWNTHNRLTAPDT